jgi:hypothetical protein
LRLDQRLFGPGEEADVQVLAPDRLEGDANAVFVERLGRGDRAMGWVVGHESGLSLPTRPGSPSTAAIAQPFRPVEVVLIGGFGQA